MSPWYWHNNPAQCLIRNILSNGHINSTGAHFFDIHPKKDDLFA